MKPRTRKRVPQYCDAFGTQLVWVGCDVSSFSPSVFKEIDRIVGTLRSIITGTPLQGLVVPVVTLGGGWVEINWEFTFHYILTLPGQPHRWLRVTDQLDTFNRLDWACQAGRIDDTTNTITTWVSVYD